MTSIPYRVEALRGSDRDLADQRDRRYRLCLVALCRGGPGPLADNRHVAPRLPVSVPEPDADAPEGSEVE